MAADRARAFPATELRIVLGQLARRLRQENALPIAHAAALSDLEREGPLTTSELAARNHMRPQSMAHTVAELEGQGLIARRPDPDDRRKALLEPTPRGRDVLEAERQRREGWLIGAIETGLSLREQELLARAIPLLDRLASQSPGEA